MTPIETLEAVCREQVRLIMQKALVGLMEEGTKNANVIADFRWSLTCVSAARSTLLKALNEVEGNR